MVYDVVGLPKEHIHELSHLISLCCKNNAREQNLNGDSLLRTSLINRRNQYINLFTGGDNY